jgi:tetratricopeptide (TPR) repeat protein
MPGERTTRRAGSRAGNASGPGKPRRSSGTKTLLGAAQITVGRFLRATRESLKLTQAQVAERSRRTPWQLSRAAVSAIERGQNFPGLEAMLALSNVLNIDPKELVERARMTAVVPVDITGLSDQDLESRASQYFWAGDFKRALSVYDAMVHKLALEAPDQEAVVARLATIEVRRATALKRAGALISAIACAERAISLSSRLPAIQAEAYVVLADLQVQRGHLPLANDAARRAADLAGDTSPRTLAWAHMVRGRALFLDRRHEEALEAFRESMSLAEACGDRQHLTHLAGNVGACRFELGDLEQAREWTERAVALARENAQPALEASWLVELGRIAIGQDRDDEADRLAEAALRIARPLSQELTMFRAEWLRHRIAERARPPLADRERMLRLQELYQKLEGHEGIDEIVQFRESRLRAQAVRGET